jgi:HD-GYP domain-containing protein (c-di-GMP phosphodiesterase class II)
MAMQGFEFTDAERVAEEVFLRLADKADAFERYGHAHASRMVVIADEIAKLLGFARTDRSVLRLATLAHDFGELAMDREYIARGGRISETERLDIARHPVIGEQEAARSGAERGVQLLVRWHHEWWNGMGYPDALRREQIPLGARIIRVVDSYCAMTDDRPHRPAISEEDARLELANRTGIEFDPTVVRIFLSLRHLSELRSYAKQEVSLEFLDSPPAEGSLYTLQS